MAWKLPHKIKYLEAVGALADERVTHNESGAIVVSSEKTKKYRVFYDLARNGIIADDPMSKFQGTIGYPILSFLFSSKKLKVPEEILKASSGIPWKAFAVKHKNNWDNVYEEARLLLKEKGIASDDVETFINGTAEQLEKMNLKRVAFPKK